jgi:hypothetical protein
MAAESVGPVGVEEPPPLPPQAVTTRAAAATADFKSLDRFFEFLMMSSLCECDYAHSKRNTGATPT